MILSATTDNFARATPHIDNNSSCHIEYTLLILTIINSLEGLLFHITGVITDEDF